MSKKQVLKTILVPATIALASMFYIQGASANACSPNIMSKINKAANEQLQNDIGIINQQGKQRQQQTQDINDGIFGCTDIWPTGDFGFKLPDITDILRKMGEEAMNKACNLARDKVREQTDKINQSVSLDTSAIDGFDELGLGRYELGSAKTTGGTSNNGGFNVNNNTRGSGNNDWNSISNAIGSLK